MDSLPVIGREPLHEPDAVQAVALSARQLNKVDCPSVIDAGTESKLRFTAAGAGPGPETTDVWGCDASSPQATNRNRARPVSPLCRLGEVDIMRTILSPMKVSRSWQCEHAEADQAFRAQVGHVEIAVEPRHRHGAACGSDIRHAAEFTAGFPIPPHDVFRRR